jgi:phosphomannomutase
MVPALHLSELMQTSNVRFGTSGARGRVVDMTDQVCMAYALGFLQMLRERGDITGGTSVAIAGDLRGSTGRIMAAVAAAVTSLGHPLVNAGRIPSPAVALYGLSHQCPAIMVTGSHIPDDRNGIKFNTPKGEILKTDEQAIMQQSVVLPEAFDEKGMWRSPPSVSQLVDPEAENAYRERWIRAFPPGFLRGKPILVYGHSAVGRELLVQILEQLGAKVTQVGWSNTFLPVDTEAIRAEDIEQGRLWGAEHSPFAIVSTDGDSDRPLLADETGTWLRGDVLGVLAARQLGARVVVTPVSSNTVVERSKAFQKVERTRIGSPYVIEAMLEQVARGEARVLGYEANGGLLTATDFLIDQGGLLGALPTRDPIVVILSVLAAAISANKTIAELSTTLPMRVTHSGRIQEFPTENSDRLLRALREGGQAEAERLVGELSGHCVSIELTDGVRMTTDADEIIHLRASGNAPELRCYAEATSQERASFLVEQVLLRIRERC